MKSLDYTNIIYLILMIAKYNIENNSIYILLNINNICHMNKITIFVDSIKKI